MKPRIVILGLGNVLMGDDGAGPFATATFVAQYEFPEDVQVEDIGTPGLDLSPYLAGVDTVILVDTVLSDAPPGTIRLYDKAALLRTPLQPRLSPHDPAVGQCLAMLEMEGVAPREMLLVGIVPENVKFGPGLSASVKSAIPLCVDRVVAELAARGAGVTPRMPALQPDLWWEVPLIEAA
jgi:hydrogenase maturation protease